MAGHVLRIGFESDTNTDAIDVLPEVLKQFGWDGQSDPAVFARTLIRGWAENALAGKLRGDVLQEAKEVIAKNLIDID